MIRRLFARWRFAREHRWTQAHLSEYVDAELAPAASARVEEHVALCPQCHRVLATLRRTLEGLRSLGPGPSTGTADAVIGRLREEG
jgi:anti-sigma factor RsiW